jgi:hypothetical protein
MISPGEVLNVGLQALQDELYPKPPSCIPFLFMYCGTKDKETQKKSQELYEEKSYQTIHKLVKILKSNTVGSKYKTVLRMAARARRSLARQQNIDQDSEDFGLRREPKIHSSRNAFMTILRVQYQEYGKFLKKVVEQAIQKSAPFELDQGIVIEDVSIPLEENPLKLTSSVAICRLSSKVLLEKPYIYAELGTFDVFLVSVRLNCDGRPSIETSKYIVPIAIENSPVIIHTDPKAFEDLEKIIEEQFHLCLLKEPDTNRLKKKVAIFRYLLAQATLYQRGSAAIAEWIEKAIYKYHGFNFDYKYPKETLLEKKPSGDLDAFTNLHLTKYLNIYMKNAHIQVLVEHEEFLEAVRLGNLPVIQEFLETEKYDWLCGIALIYAVESGHLKIVQKLLQKEISLRFRGKALIAAIENNHFEIVKVLLPMEISSRERGVAVILAAKNDDVEMVASLLKGSSTISKEDKQKAKAVAVGSNKRKIYMLLDL